MTRLAKGVREADQPELSADLEEMLEHLKWNLWHGKVDRLLRGKLVGELALPALEQLLALGVETADLKLAYMTYTASMSPFANEAITSLINSAAFSEVGLSVMSVRLVATDRPT